MKRDNDCERDVLRIEDNPGFKSALPIRNLKRKKKDVSVCFTENEFDEREECFEGNRSSPLMIWPRKRVMLRYATRSPRSKPVYYSAKTRDAQLIASINERSPSGRSSGFERFPTHSLRYAWTIAMRRFLLLSLLFTCQHSGSCFERDKRYLVFPTPGTSAPTKVQVYNSGNSWSRIFAFFFLFSNKQYLLKLFFFFLSGKFNASFLNGFLVSSVLLQSFRRSRINEGCSCPRTRG